MSLPEAFFANAVALVEGDHDRAILEGAAARTRPFNVDGIAVAMAGGKGQLTLPHAILTELGVPTFCLFDNDQGGGVRMLESGQERSKVDQQERATRRENREILRYLGVDEDDFPTGILSSTSGAVPDKIETELAEHWPAWTTCREELIESGRGVTGKNAATYALAAAEAKEEPTGLISEIFGAIRAL